MKDTMGLLSVVSLCLLTLWTANAEPQQAAGYAYNTDLGNGAVSRVFFVSGPSAQRFRSLPKPKPYVQPLPTPTPWTYLGEQSKPAPSLARHSVATAKARTFASSLVDPVHRGQAMDLDPLFVRTTLDADISRTQPRVQQTYRPRGNIYDPFEFLQRLFPTPQTSFQPLYYDNMKGFFASQPIIVDDMVEDELENDEVVEESKLLQRSAVESDELANEIATESLFVTTTVAPTTAITSEAPTTTPPSTIASSTSVSELTTEATQTTTETVTETTLRTTTPAETTSAASTSAEITSRASITAETTTRESTPSDVTSRVSTVAETTKVFPESTESPISTTTTIRYESPEELMKSLLSRMLALEKRIMESIFKSNEEASSSSTVTTVSSTSESAEETTSAATTSWDDVIGSTTESTSDDSTETIAQN